MKSAIILCSGGLDSVVTSYYVKKKLGYRKIKFLFFNYGQRTLRQERKTSRFFCNKLKGEFIDVKLDWLGEISGSLINNSERDFIDENGLDRKMVNGENISSLHNNKTSGYQLSEGGSDVELIKNRQDETLNQDVLNLSNTKNNLKNTKKESNKYYVPFRNGIFLSYAIALADSLFIKNKIKNKKEVWDIFVGFKCEGKEAFPDTTPEFVKAINNLMKVGKIKGKVFAPLIEKDKEDIILLGSRLSVELSKTFSCYVGVKGSWKHCGVCLACKLRRAGFYWGNVKDETEYEKI